MTKHMKAWIPSQWLRISNQLHKEGYEVVSKFRDMTQYTFQRGEEIVIVDLMY